MRIIRQRAYARAGLVGNPSDGYHGKTISVIVRNFFATVTLYEWERIELLLSQEDHSRFESIDSLVEDVKLHGYYGGIRLVKATIKRFAEFCAEQRAAHNGGYELSADKFSIRYESNIPRQVGLAGSSAIIVATLRALMEFYGVRIPQHVLPSLALSVEKNELGIGAGLQDRVIQVYQGVVYMDFSEEATTSHFDYDCGTYESLDPSLLPPLYVAYTRDERKPSAAVHNPLRERYEREEEVRSAMQEWASYAAQAREAILQRDTSGLAALIDQNFELRKRIIENLNPNHVGMVEKARSVGASANYTGSGGAIIGTCRDDEMFQELRRKLRDINCEVLKPMIA
ncbi:MAG: GHMP kinase [Planctomycetes bacterium]|nr:GHMP kinase [Planctomycetota bacterium]